MDITLKWNEEIRDNEVVEFLLNYPKKSNTGNYILDGILDFSNMFIPYYIRNTVAKRLNDLEDALLEYYKTESRYELQIFDLFHIENSKIKTYFYRFWNVIIYYPKLTITNSEGISINTYDTYVKFQLFTSYNLAKLSYDFRLRKLHQSNKENKYYYAHSHCNLDGENYNSFCLGTGYFSLKHSYQKTDKNTYIFDFHMLTQTLSWESIEGVPFKYITNLTPYKIEYNDVAYTNYNCFDDNKDLTRRFIYPSLTSIEKKLLKKLIELNDKSVFEYVLNSNNKISIVLNFTEEIHEYICEEILINDKHYKYKDDKYYSFNLGFTNNEIIQYSIDFYFKGKEVLKTIEPLTKNNLTKFYNNLIENYEQLPNRVSPTKWRVLKQRLEIYINSVVSRKENPEKWKNIDEGCILAKNEISMSKYSKW